MGDRNIERRHVGRLGQNARRAVHKILGASVQKIPVYGSGGWISYSDEELLEEVLVINPADSPL